MVPKRLYNIDCLGDGMTSKLEIFTPAGQATLEHERMAYALFENLYSGYVIKHTDKTLPAPYDGWIIRNVSQAIVGIVETKCRVDVNAYEFATKYHNKWLLTETKLKIAANHARLQRVPLFGFLFLVQGRVLMIKRLADSNGELVEYETKEMTTKANVNGGEAFRINAFIDMTNCPPMQLPGVLL